MENEENKNPNMHGHIHRQDHGHWGKEKKHVMKLLAIFLLITSVFMVFQTIGAYKENKYIGQNGPNLVSFTGQGEVFAVADIVTFSFSTIDEAETPSEAQNISAEKINKALDFLRENGIADKDIKTVNFRLTPRYEFREADFVQRFVGERVLVGYEVRQTIAVKVREVEKAGELLAGISETGVSDISGLDFSIDDEDDLKREARKLAIEDAEQKAEELAKDLGVKLVRIVSFSESGATPFFARTASFDEMSVKAVGVAITPEIPLGENKITSNITITYELR